MRETEFLTESQNYNEMLNPLLSVMPSFDLQRIYRNKFEQQISWAKSVLKRRDRITWYLRYARLYLAISAESEEWVASGYGEPEERYFIISDEADRKKLADLLRKWRRETGVSTWEKRNLDNLRRQLTHFLGTPAPGIEETIFDRQSPDAILARFERLETEWRTRSVQELDPEGKVLVSFPDGWAWYMLDRASCDQEANAMGHCGNQFGNPNDRLLSLRRRLPNGKDRPSLTFILDSDGYLGEMKGRENNKPAAKYHPYIIALLKLPMINGLKGGGHDPANNFSIADLSEEQRQEVYRVKPELMTCMDYLNAHGADDRLGRMMKKAFDALDLDTYLSPVGLVKVGGEYRFALEADYDWMAILRRYCDGMEVLDSDVRDYIGIDGDDEWMENAIDGLPTRVRDRVWEYIDAEAGDELRKIFGDDYLNDTDEGTVLQMVEKLNTPRDLIMDLRDAVEHGYEVGTNNAITKALRREAETGFGRHFKLDTTPDENGMYYLWCTPAYWCHILDDPASSFEDDSLLDETPSISSDISHYIESDSQAEVKYFIENGPEECQIEIPKFKPVSEMSFDEIRAELIQLGKTPEWIDRYYGGSFESKLPSGLTRERTRVYGVAENLTEAHHTIDGQDSTQLGAIKRNDTVRVFHGFRETTDALRVAQQGISGASRVGRVYSYEADNNPRGLFVTLSRDVAARFVGAYGTRTIMEFNARVDDLEAPVWPNGRFTVQGEFASYFGRGHEGRRNRAQARKQQRDLAAQNDDERIRSSDDPLLAQSLIHNSELQALFIGHLSPRDITAFWVEKSRGDWHRYTVEEYLTEFRDQYHEKDVMQDHWNKVFSAGEDFDGDKFMTAMLEKGGEDVDNTLRSLWSSVLRAPQQQRASNFIGYFGTFLYPKQIIPAMQWMKNRYGRE